MKKSTITFEVELDEKNIPAKILWDATDKPSEGMTETKSLSIAVWDEKQKNTLRIDLWTQDMPILEMKRFHIDSLGGIAQTVLTSTGDEHMAGEINALCERLVKYLKEKKDE
jgi:gliding motility-associated protein GldC